MNARIGKGVYVHAIKAWNEDADWALAECEVWCGRYRPTPEKVSCKKCQKATLDALTEEAEKLGLYE